MEIFYHLIANLAIFPLCKALFNLSLTQTGISYISNSNYLQFLSNPLNYPILILILLILTIFVIFEMSSIIVILNQASHDAELNILQLFKESFRRAVRALKPQNWLIILLVMCLAPFAEFSKLSTVIGEVRVPSFIAERTIDIFPWNFVFGALIILLALHVFPRLLTLFYFVINKDRATTASQKSYKLLKSNREKDLVLFILFYIIVLGLSSVASIAFDKSISFLVHILAKGNIGNYLFIAINDTNKYIIKFLLSSIGVFANFAYLLVLKNSKEKSEPQSNPVYITPKDSSAHKHNIIVLAIVTATILIISMTLNVSITYTIKHAKNDPSLYNSGTVSVIAHRGDDKDAPENTIPAFQKAVDAGVDYVELDVQETKDGVIVVTHDSNFRRCTGHNGNVWEMTYDEVEQLDAGLKFSHDYAGTKIPSLDKVIKFAKGKVKLLIELKVNGHNPDLAKDTLQVIKKNHAENDVMIQSLSYAELQKVKAIDPQMKCGYILPFAIGNYRHLDAADFFTIETTSITPDNIDNIHELGKQIYAWTVDKNSDIERVIDAGVDGIITDRIYDVKYKLKESDDIFRETYKAFL